MFKQKIVVIIWDSRSFMFNFFEFFDYVIDKSGNYIGIYDTDFPLDSLKLDYEDEIYKDGYYYVLWSEHELTKDQKEAFKDGCIRILDSRINMLKEQKRMLKSLEV